MKKIMYLVFVITALNCSQSVLAQLVIEATDVLPTVKATTYDFDGEGEVKDSYSGGVFDLRGFDYVVSEALPENVEHVWPTFLSYPIQLGDSDHRVLTVGPDGSRLELLYIADREGILVTPLQEVPALRIDIFLQLVTPDSIIKGLDGYVFLTKSSTFAELAQDPGDPESDEPVKHILYIRDWGLNISFHNTFGDFADDPVHLLSQSLNASEKDTVKICADGSEATLVSIIGTIAGVAMEDIGLSFKGDPVAQNEAEFGSFALQDVFADKDSLVFRYTHPRIVNSTGPFNDLTLRVVDKNDPAEALFEQPVQMYRAPVVMVHGLWSEAAAFTKMRNSFVESQLWPQNLTYPIQYKNSADAHFSKNWPIVKDKINKFILRLIRKKISTGRTNVVAHSMGGILTRLFIQSADYDNQVARLVTLNTPHSGSQWGDFLTDDPCGQLVSDYLDFFNSDTKRGAISDLRVNGNAILRDLNGATLNLNTAPSHSIITSAVVTTPSARKSWVRMLLRKMNFLLVVAGSTIDEAIQSTQDFINTTLNDETNDVIVSSSSQSGGLSRKSTILNTAHMGAAESDEVIEHVSILLRQDSEDAFFFSRSGYNPRRLTHDFENSVFDDVCKFFSSQNSLAKNTDVSSEFKITSPLSETTLQPGETISITFTGTESFPIVLFTGGSRQAGIINELDEVSTGTFTYAAPLKAIGRIRLNILSYSKEAKFVSDEIYVNIQPSATVNSISIEPDYIVLDSIGFEITVSANFSDGISRDITEAPELILNIENPTLAVFDNDRILQAVALGETEIQASYKGKLASTTVRVKTLPNPTSIKQRDFNNNSKLTIPPASFTLNQNHPNPFNASTTIIYNLEKEAYVRLTIYNSKGQMSVRLVNQIEFVGEHKVMWAGVGNDGKTLPSGIYFFELRVGENESAVKKMVFLK